MLSLIRFLSRYIFFIQFLALEIFCFYLIVQNSYYQKAQFVSSSNAIVGSTYNSYDKFVNYLSLAETNETLANENAQFRSNSIQSYKKVFGNAVVINDTTYKQKYAFIEGKIINKSINKRSNYITINRGNLQGIEAGMGVITGNGVVGIVKHTSMHYSTVMILLHKDIMISAKIKKNNYAGSITWDGKNNRIGQLNDIPIHVNLEVGDTIITSGYSAIFPENIPIGVVTDFEPPRGKNFYDINVSFSIDFQNVAYAYVIKNFFKEEQKELENLIETDD